MLAKLTVELRWPTSSDSQPRLIRLKDRFDTMLGSPFRVGGRSDIVAEAIESRISLILYQVVHDFFTKKQNGLNMSKEIKRHLHNDFEIDGDYEVFMKIVEDMESNAGILKPAINWGIEIATHSGSDYFNGVAVEKHVEIKDAYEKKYSTMQKMMDPWIGCIGMHRVTEETIDDYSAFVRLVDRLDLSAQYFDKSNSLTEKGKGLLNTDLGTIIDLNLINAFSAKEKISVLEVGGGYGRLAEGFFEAIGAGKTKYLMLDSVPASLLYSYKYMSRNFPELRIGFYYNGDELDFDVFDCYIMPTWHYLPTDYKFAACVNIQSMQEMEQHHVDYFLDLFDKSVAPDGIIYLSNEKDYVFQGAWNYPNRWSHILSVRTPRSWTRNSPTEIYSVNPRRDQYELAGHIAYEVQLIEYDKVTRLKEENLPASAAIAQLQEEVTCLRDENLSASATVLQLQDKVTSLTEENLSASATVLQLQDKVTSLTEENLSASAIVAQLKDRISFLEVSIGRRLGRKLASLLSRP
jgi:hypothetical protein